MRGDPSDEELAALTAVVAGLASAEAAAVGSAAPRSAWADPAHRLRTPLHPEPGAWRASTRPH